MGKFREFEPKKCWVGEQQKIIYDSREEAEAAAWVAQFDYGGEKLYAYKCEYGEHWHLTGKKVKINQQKNSR